MLMDGVGLFCLGGDGTYGWGVWRSGVQAGVTEVYLKVFQDYLPELHQEDWIFMQDNAPLHTYGSVRDLFRPNGWGHEIPYSPDPNPIRLGVPQIKPP